VPNGRKKSRIDVVWMTMKGRVKDEINAMVKEAGGTHEATEDDIFKYRTAATKRVFLDLTLDEQADILKKVVMDDVVVPDEIKQL